MNPPSLRGRGLTVRYAASTVVDDVDLVVWPGEVLALVGPNGAGKSTLLAVLAGDQTASSGTVEVHGRDLAAWRLGDLARTRSVLPQERHVSFPFTVTEVVRMGRTPWRGRPEEDDDDRAVEDALAVSEVGALRDRPFGQLSGGEQGRTAFARVQAQQTGILLLDEPTAALDLGHQEKVLGRARLEADRGSAVVVVLHDLSLAAAWSDRVLLLDRGRVAATGTPAEVFTAELLSRVYEFPVDVVRHPATGELLVLPDRRRATPPRTPAVVPPLTEEVS